MMLRCRLDSCFYQLSAVNCAASFTVFKILKKKFLVLMNFKNFFLQEQVRHLYMTEEDLATISNSSMQLV